ncbi:MAG: YfhO family protein, partial [Bacilli bacterium]
MQKEKSLLLHRISHKDHPIIRDLLFAGLSFLLVFLFGILIFSLNGFSPFVSGGKTILMSDGNGQYIAYYRDYRNILLNHGSLIYTLKKCFGGDYQSIFSYYLASPFNLLLVLVKEAEIPDFLIFSNLAKMAIAGFQMSLLLSRQGKNNRFLSLALSFSYGVMSYCFVYFFTPMWLDGAMVLPLVVLGLLDMMKKKEYWLYPLALAYALYSSWYTGAMICFFSVLFFLDEFFFHTE